MKKSQIKLGNSTEILEFEFELKIFDDCEKVKGNSTFSKCLINNNPQSFASNELTMSTSTLSPVCS